MHRYALIIALGVHTTPTLAADTDDISGRVVSSRGPEAGVWVIAETQDLPTEFSRIVVTGDDGRFVVPDLPKASYRVWVRGYGLRDSDTVAATPGQDIALTVPVAASAAEAAEIYPANYWFSLFHPPGSAAFPGSGANGVAPTIATQQEWLAAIKEECIGCHPMGGAPTRNLAGTGDPIALWAKRLADGTGPDPDPYLEGMQKGQRPAHGRWLCCRGQFERIGRFR